MPTRGAGIEAGTQPRAGIQAVLRFKREWRFAAPRREGRAGARPRDPPGAGRGRARRRVGAAINHGRPGFQYSRRPYTDGRVT